jgi:chaperonin GroES
MKLKPLGDRVIVKPIDQEQVTASGLVLPDTAKERPQRGRVLAVGEGRWGDDGERVALEVQEGDEIIYAKYGGTEIKLDGEDVLILQEHDILATVSGSAAPAKASADAARKPRATRKTAAKK